MKSTFLFNILLTLSTASVSGFSVQSTSTRMAVPTTLFSTEEATNAPSTASAPGIPETNQPKYGKELEFPGTYVRCGRCATSYAIAAEDLGTGKGRRVECALCGHSWFQTPERLFTLNNGHELIPLPESEVKRINSNVEKGRDADYIGDTKFYVGNLDFSVEEDDIRELFETAGEVGGVNLVIGPDGRSRGFAFVTMMNEEDTDKCMDLDGSDLNGRNINVKPPNN